MCSKVRRTQDIIWLRHTIHKTRSVFILLTRSIFSGLSPSFGPLVNLTALLLSSPPTQPPSAVSSPASPSPSSASSPVVLLASAPCPPPPAGHPGDSREGSQRFSQSRAMMRGKRCTASRFQTSQHQACSCHIVSFEMLEFRIQQERESLLWAA